MDQAMIQSNVLGVAQQMRSLGHEVYVNLEDDDVVEGQAPGTYVVDAIKKLEECDALLALKVVKGRSEGQLMEIGAAKAWGKPVVLCLKHGMGEGSYMDDSNIADQVLIWTDTTELLKKPEDITV